MATLPETTYVPWKPDAILRAIERTPRSDPAALIEYMRQLVEYLDRVYADISNTVNKLNSDVEALKARYDAHTTHPPPT